MILATLLAALQPAAAAPAPDPGLACAPVRNMTAAGPPPALFGAQRMETAPRFRLWLSVHNCPRGEGGYRVERRSSGANDQFGELEWVPTAQCPAILAWIEAGTRLHLPAPMLSRHRDPVRPIRGTWFTLDTGRTAGAGTIVSLELQVLEPPGVPPGPLASWFREGERLFQACRDQGHGGAGDAPRDPSNPRGRE
jgi:hypothetical protein